MVGIIATIFIILLIAAVDCKRTWINHSSSSGYLYKIIYFRLKRTYFKETNIFWSVNQEKLRRKK